MRTINKVITQNGVSINIMKYAKPGTKRIFFYPETLDGKRISLTNWAVRVEAINLAKKYINDITK